MFIYEVKNKLTGLITDRWTSEGGLNEKHYLPSFGKKGGWYAISELTASELEHELERKTEDNGIGNHEVKVLIPDMYDVIIDDITEELEAEKQAKKDFKDKLKKHKEKKNRSKEEIEDILDLLLADYESRT